MTSYDDDFYDDAEDSRLEEVETVDDIVHNLTEINREHYPEQIKNDIKEAVREQREKEDRENAPPAEPDKSPPLTVSQAIRAKDERRYSVYGRVSSIMPPFRMVKAREEMRCNSKDCGVELEREEYKYPLFHAPMRSRVKCPTCDEPLSNISYDYVPTIRLELTDVDTFSDHPEGLAVYVFGDHTKEIRLGGCYTVTGKLHVESSFKTKKYMAPAFYALDSVVYDSSADKSNTELTAVDIEAFERFAKKLGDKLIDKLVWMHTPEVIGLNFVKEGLLMVEVSTTGGVGALDATAIKKEMDRQQKRQTSTTTAKAAITENKRRDKINAGIVGPPGGAKSTLLRSSVRHSTPNSRYEDGQHSSGKSLTAIVEKSEDGSMLRIGPAVLARGGILAVNEVGTMPDEEQSMLLSVMEESIFSHNKFGYNNVIKADTTVIISANPADGGSNWLTGDNGDGKIDLDEVPVGKPFLDRLDLLFTLKNSRNEDYLREYDRAKRALDDRPIRNYDPTLQKYLQYARAKYKTIEINDEASNILGEYYISLGQKIGSPRLRETLFRLCRARARLKLKGVADAQDAKETVEYYNIVIRQFTDTVVVPENPILVAEKIMTDILRTSKMAILLSDLARRACGENKQVKSYLFYGEHTEKSAYYIHTNWKLRSVLKSLLAHSSKIKQVQKNPVALQWIEDFLPDTFTSTEEECNRNSEKLCELSDAADAAFSPEKQEISKVLGENHRTLEKSIPENLKTASGTSDTSHKISESKFHIEAEPKNMQFFEQTLQDLQRQIGSATLDHDKLKKALIASGRFTASESHYIIEYAIATKILEKIDWHEYKLVDDDIAQELYTGDEGE